MEDKYLNIAVKCPVCGWRVFDKLTVTSGVVELKCPKCKSIVTIDLAFRLAEPQSRQVGYK